MSSIFNTPPNTTDPMELLRYFQELRDSRIDTFRKSTSQFPSVFNRPERLAEDTNEKGNNYLASIFDSLSVQTAEAVEQVGPTIARIKEEQKQEQILNKLNLEDTSFDAERMININKTPIRKEVEAIDGSVTKISPEGTGVFNNSITTGGNSAGKVEEGLVSRPYDAERMIDINKSPGFQIPEYKVYTSADDMSDLEILARTIHEEAKGESFEGKIAVGATILNRASSGSYGSSAGDDRGIKGVILQPLQFSPWNKYTSPKKHAGQDKDMMKTRASEDAYRAAYNILIGNYTDPTNGATHYVNEAGASKRAKNTWIPVMKAQKKGTIKIGNHLFGNADNNKIYDGKSWLAFTNKLSTSSRPKIRSGDSLMAKTTPIKKPTNAIEVKKGQTLSGIAKANNTTVAILKKANNIKDENKINVGQSISIPTA